MAVENTPAESNNDTGDPVEEATLEPASKKEQLLAKTPQVLKTGQRVLLKGLEKAKELNGHRGVIIKWKPDVSRYAVRVAGKEMAIKPENLQTEGGAAEAQKWAEKHRNVKGVMYNPVLAYRNVPGAGPKMTQWVGQMKAGRRVIVRAEQSTFCDDEPIPLWFGDHGFVKSAPVDVALLISGIDADPEEWSQAISRVLGRFPVAAGRLRVARRDNQAAWQILLNNAGIPFTTATVPPCSLPQAEELQRIAIDEKCGFFDLGADDGSQDSSIEFDPLLRIKLITEEATGRGLLGISFNHALCDIYGIGLLLRWLHHELDNTEKPPDTEPCHNRQLAEETLKGFPSASDADVESHLTHWPLSSPSTERWCFLGRRIRAGCRGPPDGVGTVALSIHADGMTELKSEAAADGAAAATAFEALVCYVGLKLLCIGRHGRRCIITKDYRTALGATAPGNGLENLFANAVTHGLSFEMPADVDVKESLPLAEACLSMRCAIEAADFGYIAWQRQQDHFRGLPNFFSSLCCNSWGKALASISFVEAYAIGMRSVDERAATMSFPLDTAYMQVLPQPSGTHTVLVTMPMSDLRALLKELPETHFQVPHVSEIRSHPFKVPLPATIMERLSPAVEDIYKTVRIACIGDSITACGYPKHLQAMFDKADIRVQVRNFGVAGATVQRFSDQPFWDEKKKEDARQWRPHFAIFTFGSNDAKENNWDIEAFEQDYRDMCKEFLECMHPRPVVSLVTPPPLYEEDAYDMQQSIINSVLPEIIPRVAQAAEEIVMKPLRDEAARCRISVPEEFVAHTDIIDVFTSLGGAELRRRNYMAEDGVHPNERGTKLLTYVVFAHIRREVQATLAKWRDAPKVVEDSGMF